jgi:hypothetical protein
MLFQIKKFIRSNGWPSNHEARNVLWPLLCHYKDFDSSKVLYTTQLEEITHQGGMSGIGQ